LLAGNRLYILRTEMDDLIDRFKSTKDSEKTRILVRIMDLEENIAKAAKDEKRSKYRI
jgi:hypothetical protein